METFVPLICDQKRFTGPENVCKLKSPPAAALRDPRCVPRPAALGLQLRWRPRRPAALAARRGAAWRRLRGRLPGPRRCLYCLYCLRCLRCLYCPHPATSGWDGAGGGRSLLPPAGGTDTNTDAALAPRPGSPPFPCGRWHGRAPPCLTEGLRVRYRLGWSGYRSLRGKRQQLCRCALPSCDRKTALAVRCSATKIKQVTTPLNVT